METKVGVVKSISGQNIFFAKDSLGNTRELKEGDTIYENEIVFSDGKRVDKSSIFIELDDKDVIVLKDGVKQLFDSSLIAWNGNLISDIEIK